MINVNEIYKIRNGVDIYLTNDELITFYFMSTRLRKQFRVSNLIVRLIELIDGDKNIKDIHKLLEKEFGKEINIDELVSIIEKLYTLNILNKVDKKSEEITDVSLERYSRQTDFFSDFLVGYNLDIEAQKQLRDSTILVFGCGAIGGNIAIQLAMCGVENFIIYDYDVVEASDICRHVYFKEKYIGMKKTDAIEDYLLDINKNINVQKIDNVLTPESKIEDLIDKATFVINTADEPYIGYTSMKISRYCTTMKKVHFIAGGFDAHLASTGELIIPGITPCVDCYAKHFKEVLKGWKPKKHPVKERYLEIGGLSSMSLFSSSYAVIEIIKYICNLIDIKKYRNTRGEFLFHNMEISYLNVSRDKDCKSCGEIVYE
ncbi:HesA/MoeB/ThiF family protein [Natronincola ferrireducens]|uniref:Molybdopterin or thiamine biosynthesis adenylyltransferase n=1 Tax=Natronincola ferrireducens TaxID=393762 RepID=A0A1G9A9A3_9FIRM|nr:ThiF family adenylyltransferase [Natronincola ferrireducens]SDK23929.1 Molybdopterin or thiamine biosynthesis adenylyltransferase [Natronincola ferrireducens]